MAAGKEVSVRLKVEADNLDAVKQKLNELGATVTQVGNLRTDGLQRQMQALEARLDPAARAAQGLAKDSDTLGKALQAGIISQARHNELLAASAQRHGAAAKGTKLTANEVTNLTYQLQDAAVQLAGGQNPFLILMQQGPQATGAVGGVGRAMSLLLTPTAAAVGAVGALGLGFGALLMKASSLQDEVRAFNVVLKATGNEAKTTAAEMQGAVNAMSNAGVARQDALAMATAYLRNGRLTGAGTAAQLGTLANDMAAGMGTSAQDAFGKLDGWLTSGVSGLRQMATETKALSVAQYEAARAALEHGDKAKALQIVVDALKQRFGGLAKESLSPAQQAMKELSTSFDDFVTKAASTKIVISVELALAQGFKSMAELLANPSAETLRNYLAANLTYGASAGAPATPPKPPAANGPSVTVPVVGAPSGLSAYPAAPGAPVPGQKPTSVNGMAIDEALRVSDAAKANTDLAAAMGKVGAARTIFLAGQAAFNAEMDKSGNKEAALAMQAQAERKARLELSGAIAEQSAQLSINTRESLKVADAYLQSAAAGERAKLMQQAQVDALTSGAAAEERYRQLLAERAAAQAATSAQALPQMRADVAARQKIAEASLLGVEAQQRAELAEKVRQATITETIALENAQGATADALRRIIEAKTAAVVADDAAMRKAQAGAILQGQGDQIAQLGKERELLFATAEQRAVGLARLQAEIQLRRQNIDASSVEGQTILANAESIAKTSTQIDKLKEVGQTFEQAWDRVGDSLTQAFVQGSAGAVSFRSVVSGVLASIATDLLKLAVLNPLKNYVLGGISGALGLFGGGNTLGMPAPTTDYGVAMQINAGTFHSGGLIGSNAPGSKVVSPALFAGARRYHTGGLVDGEVPIIAKRGEEVLTADDPRHRFNFNAANGNGGGIVIGDINVTVNAQGGTTEQNADLARQVGQQMREQVRGLVLSELRQQSRPGGMLNNAA